MRKLAIPDLSLSDIYDDCISNLRSARRIQRFRRIKPTILDLAEQYDDHGKKQQLDLIDTDNGHPPLRKKDFNYLYTGKFAKIGQPGRKHYDELMLSIPNNLCPYCDYGIVKVLDHVLPKADYSKLSITPVNLVPACDICNDTKRDKVPQDSTEVHLHPYYDDVRDEQWLFAEVVELDFVNFEFYTIPVESWPDDKNLRISNHFKLFGLSKSYSIIASSFLTEDDYLYDLFDEAGSEKLKEHLQSLAKKWMRKHKNHWKTAMYSALAQSDWFCETGIEFLKREEPEQ